MSLAFIPFPYFIADQIMLNYRIRYFFFVSVVFAIIELVFNEIPAYSNNKPWASVYLLKMLFCWAYFQGSLAWRDLLSKEVAYYRK